MVLSGARDDGAAGLTEIVKQGGQAVVQDPDEALHRSMPACALEQVPSVHVLPVAKIGTSLGELVGQGAAPITHNPVNPHLAAENEITMLEHKTTDELQAARPLSFSCPSCGGVLFELNGKPAPRFRCRVGHAWSPGSLVAEQTITVEEALWVALRALEEMRPCTVGWRKQPNNTSGTAPPPFTGISMRMGMPRQGTYARSSHGSA